MKVRSNTVLNFNLKRTKFTGYQKEFLLPYNVQAAEMEHIEIEGAGCRFNVQWQRGAIHILMHV